VCIYMYNVIDKVLLRKEVRQKGTDYREYKYKKILRQCSILAVNFWSVTYFGGFNFGTSYLGAKIGQNKTMTKISRFTVTNECTNIHLAFSYRQLTHNINCDLFEPRLLTPLEQK